ncbi:hypothetical protein CI610_03147 [invertebrate metagenome]|uniref:Uncharacterized protein n=1 Tax=invertebrate metagenome TaxID=1711999 RepID=A0A2H9T3Z0_9ZZZZ
MMNKTLLLQIITLLENECRWRYPLTYFHWSRTSRDQRREVRNRYLLT